MPGRSPSRADTDRRHACAAVSLIKPQLRRLSGSGSDADAVVVERVSGAAEIGLDMPEVELNRHLLVVQAGPPVTVEVTTAGHRHRSPLRRGELIFQPAGVPARPRWDAELRTLLVAIDPTFVQRSTGDAPGELMPRSHLRDPLLHLISEQLVTEYEQQAQPDRFYVDSLTQALVAHLVTKYSTVTRRLWPDERRPSDRRVRLAVDYLHDHLADKPTLDGMAAAAGLRPAQLAALFRAAMGVSPHRYLMQQRVDRACQLLQDTPMTIAEVATRTGFVDQSHLTRVMRRVTGITPAVLRRS